MNKTLFSLLMVLALGLAAGLPVALAAGGPQPVPGRVLVSLEPGVALRIDKSAGTLQTGQAGLDAVLQQNGALSLEPLFGNMLNSFTDPATRRDLARHYIVQHANKSGNDGLIADLKALAIVDAAESDLLLEATGIAYLPNDLASSQWHLRNMSPGGGDTHAVGGWSESLGDSNVVIAVLDTGVDWHHPDLGGPHPDKVNGALWTNWEEYYGGSFSDDDGNGFLNDIRGWDFVNVSAATVAVGEDAAPADNNPMDFNGHGTLVSGCIAPITNNGIGIAAIAPGCKIMAVRIGWHTPEGNGASYVSIMAQGFVYATANGADIINLSYTTGYTAAFESAINAALNAGLVICSSAGNDNVETAGYLQGLPDDRILTVAACNGGDTKDGFSNYGTWVDVTAPGSSIFTTAYHNSTGTSTYESTQGTSFSSPIVAGACALIWSAHPEFTSAQVAALVQSSCDNIDAKNPGFEGKLGAGRINLLKALGDNVHKYPLEFPTLYDALNSAAVGDTVKIRSIEALAGPVTVIRNGVKVFGAYDASYTTRDVVGGLTPINGGSGSPLRFSGPMDPSTEFDGFSVTGGTGQNMSVIAPGTRTAGGVLVSGVSPTLRNLKVFGNAVGSASQLGCGGGVMLTNSSAILENVEITGNTGIYGAGLFVLGGAPTLINCSIVDNTVLTNNPTYPAKGGGIHALDTQLTMTDCTVSGHLGTLLGGGVYIGGLNATSTANITGGLISGNTAKTGGGGLYHLNGTLNITGTTFASNGPTPTSTFMYGGGLQARTASTTIDGIICSGNEAQVGGGAALIGCPTATISNSVLTGNTGLYWGGGLHYDNNAAGAISGNTFVANLGDGAGGGGGGLYLANSSPVVNNNISAFNLGGPDFGNGMALESAPASMSCNNVFGNENLAYSGQPDPTGTNGNVALDPLFCDFGAGHYELMASSPCRAENSGGCGQIGALLGSCGASAVPGADGVPAVAFRVDQNFPNPFNPKTTIRFNVPMAAHTTVIIYDVGGRHVKTLVDGELPAVEHAVTWTGDDGRGHQVAAGIYFYEVSSGGHRAVGRMALVK